MTHCIFERIVLFWHCGGGGGGGEHVIALKRKDIVPINHLFFEKFWGNLF